MDNHYFELGSNYVIYIFQSIMGQCSGLSNIQPTDIIGIGGQLRDESAKGEWV